MAWRQQITDAMSDVGRFAVRAALLIDAIIVAVSSIWICFQLCRFTLRFLDRTIFSKGW